MEAAKENDASSEENRAQTKLKESLHEVRVSQVDATQVQREIEGELFSKWHEGCEVMEAKGIDVANISSFLDHMQDAYEGIGKEMRTKLDGIKFSKEWKHKIMDFKYECGSSDSKAKYGMIAFGKSKDGKFVDCMYCLYKLDFKVAPQRIVTKKDQSVLWGLIKWQTINEKEVERTLGVKSLHRVKNFFRYKALKGFYEEGLIDKINIVQSIDEVPEELE